MKRLLFIIYLHGGTRNCMLRSFFILLLIARGLPGMSQAGTTVSGKVTDRESGLPLQGISVYINNTTYSTQTDKEGAFSLTGIFSQHFSLVFSAVNYQTESIAIDSRQAGAPISLKMQKNVATLDEVVIAAPAGENTWAKYGNTFLQDILGYSEFSRECTILNPEALRFRKNTRENTLKASAKAPLKIRNNALGYEITYWLNEYEHRFSTQTISHKGHTQFTEMPGSRSKKEKWRKNRRIAYQGSLTHFLRAVYDGKTSEEGFIVNLIKEVPYKDIGLYIPVFIDTLTIQSSAAFTKFIDTMHSPTELFPRKHYADKAKRWLADKSGTAPFIIPVNAGTKSHQAYFFVRQAILSDRISVYAFNVENIPDTNRVQWKTAGTVIADQKALNRINGYNSISETQRSILKVKLFFSDAIDPNLFVNRKGGSRYLHFTGEWQVTFTKEGKEKEYLARMASRSGDAGYQESVLYLAGNEPVLILPNGYTDSYSFITGAYWSYEKMDKMLPLDYMLH